MTTPRRALLAPALITRRPRALARLAAALLLALLTSACLGSGPPAPTPDPFGQLGERSDQAFREGLESYAEGRYREALTAFDRARLLHPTGDPRIDQMAERARTALLPTATPEPPTPTPPPAAPTLAPMSAATPDTELGNRYFGLVSLVIVPGRNTSAPPASQFFYQDQVALRIEGLDRYLRLPFTLRTFDVDSGRAVAEVRSDGASLTPVAAAPPAANAEVPISALLARASTSSATPGATIAPTAYSLVRFWDHYVWYHEGGEAPGRYRVELYANGTLTHVFDYVVGTVPVAPTATPAPAVAEPEPVPVAPEPPVVIVQPRIEAPAPVVAAPVAPSAPAAPPTARPEPPTAIPLPTATLVPTPSTANTTIVGGLPAGVDVNASDGRVFVADASGVVWTADHDRPTLRTPFNLDRLPVDLAVDQFTGNVYVSARLEPAILVLDSTTGRRLGTIDMPVSPGTIQIDSDLGLLYVALPERQSLAVVDVRAGQMIRSVSNLPQVTGLALDPERHVLFVSHLGGQLSVIDVASSQLTGRLQVTSAGLAGVATARGLAYAINTATHELVVVEPVQQAVQKFRLVDEPAAVAAGEASGSVYVLASRPNVLIRFDPTDGTEIGRVLLPDRSGRFGVRAPAQDQADFQGLRARMAISRADETVYITLPETGSLSAIASELFPQVANEIPQLAPDRGRAVNAPIQAVLRPAPAPPIEDVRAAAADEVPSP